MNVYDYVSDLEDTVASDRDGPDRRRAGALGLALAALCTLLAGALLLWSGSHVRATGWDSVPVSEAVNWCVAAVAGVIALALAFSCLLGVRHLLRPEPSPPHPLCLPVDVPWLASRAAAVLVTLTLGSTSALANPTTEPLPIPDTHHPGITTAPITPAPVSTVTTSRREIRVGGHASIRHTATQRVGPDSETDADGPTDTVVAVPDWRPVRAELPVPALASHARPQTNRPVSFHASVLADRPVREPDEDSVVVRRGDSLWRIAAQELGPGASDAHIAARWPQWYAANRLTIGPDPDHIVPGQILDHPGTSPTLPPIGERP